MIILYQVSDVIDDFIFFLVSSMFVLPVTPLNDCVKIWARLFETNDVVS